MQGEMMGLGDNPRSVEAEHAYNRRWLVGMLVTLLLLSLLASGWMFAVAGRVPDPLAVHWNSKNEADNWAPLWSIAAGNVALSLGAGGLLVVIAVLSRGQNTLIARVGAGLGLGFGLAMSALMMAVVAGQIDVADTSHAVMSGPAMGAGLAVSAMAGTLVMWRYRPGDIDRTPDPAVLAASRAVAEDPGLAADSAAKAAQEATLRIPVGMGRWAWPLSMGIGAVAGVSMYFIFPVPGLLLGVGVTLLTRVFCSGTVIIGPEGHKVLAGGFWKIMPLAWQEVRGVTVEDLKAVDYGGWGYRMHAGKVKN